MEDILPNEKEHAEEMKTLLEALGKNESRLFRRSRRGELAMRTVILVIVVLLLIGALPTWPYSSGWGYYPSGGLGLVLVIVLILALTGRL